MSRCRLQDNQDLSFLYDPENLVCVEADGVYRFEFKEPGVDVTVKFTDEKKPDQYVKDSIIDCITTKLKNLFL